MEMVGYEMVAVVPLVIAFTAIERRTIIMSL
jgi:hypothetical protein